MIVMNLQALEQTAGRFVIGIGDHHVGSDPMTSIGLGSCVALVLHDEDRMIGGMAHVMLPASNGRQDRPGKFADTAIVVLREELRLRGCRNGSVVAKLVGGASMFKDFSGNLNIGERNLESLRSLALKHHLAIRAEETGGTFGRSLTYYPADHGRVSVRRADGKCFDI